jgi:hypothetical protein
VKRVINLRIASKTGNFLTGQAAVAFSRMTAQWSYVSSIISTVEIETSNQTEIRINWYIHISETPPP